MSARALPSLDMCKAYKVCRTDGVTVTLGRNGYGYCVDRQYPDGSKPISHCFGSDRNAAFRLYSQLRDHALAVAALKGESVQVAA